MYIFHTVDTGSGRSEIHVSAQDRPVVENECTPNSELLVGGRELREPNASSAGRNIFLPGARPWSTDFSNAVSLGGLGLVKSKTCGNPNTMRTLFSKFRPRSGPFLLSTCLVAGVAGCSSDDGGTGSSTGAGNGAGTGVGAGNGDGDISLETGGTGSTASSGDGDGDGLGEDEVCAGITLETESVVREIPMEVERIREINGPVTMFIMLDNSKSMGQTSDGTHTTWEQAEIALTDFAQDPASEGINVGIQYFHPTPYDLDGDGDIDSDEEGDECDGLIHSKSEIEVGRLPAVAPALVQSLAGTEPQSNTPTVGALTGAVNFCREFHETHPDERCVVVFITDGQPNGCGLSLDCTPGFTPDEKDQCVDPQAETTLVPIASTGLAAGVSTFTVGMTGVSPDGFYLLDALAVAGGTDCTPDIPGSESCNISETGGAGLRETLNLIRDGITVTETITLIETVVGTSRVPCTWEVPEAPAGQTLDPNLVNVNLTNSAITDLGRVPDVSGCSAGVDGWYYDDPVAPSSIQLCPQTCTTVEQNPDIGVNVIFGCETKPAVVH